MHIICAVCALFVRSGVRLLCAELNTFTIINADVRPEKALRLSTFYYLFFYFHCNISKRSYYSYLNPFGKEP